jgi:hypothetical protein
MWTVQAKWARSPSSNVDHYHVTWYLNGGVIGDIDSEDCESTRDGFMTHDTATVEVSAVSAEGKKSTNKSASMIVGQGGGAPEPPGDIELTCWKTENDDAPEA